MSSRQEVVALAEHADDKVFERTGARLGLDHFVPEVRAWLEPPIGYGFKAARAWIDDHVKELPAGKVPSKSFHFPDPPTAREREDRRVAEAEAARLRSVAERREEERRLRLKTPGNAWRD